MNEAVSIEPVLSTAIGAILVVAAVAKCLARQRVERFVVELGVPDVRASTVVIGVIATELAVGAVTLTGAVPLVAGVAAASLATIFVAVQTRALRTTAHPCSCFGAVTIERSHYVGFVRAVVLLTASALVVVKLATSSEPMASQLPNGPESFAGVALTITILLTSTLLDQVLWFNSVRLRGASSR